MPLEKEGLKEEARAFIESIPLYRPREIEKKIRVQGYVGQDNAVKSVSLMAYRHVRRLKNLFLGRSKRDSLPPKTNMLFIGPTGCGKTYLVEILFQKILKLPTVIIDITSYSETGYVGQDTNNILTRLLYAADFNPIKAGFGIICLDEFDKLASGQNNAVFAGAGTTKDVSGLGVQRELLKMLESADIPVPLEFSHSDYTPKVVISTQDITFIACGAFSGFKGMLALESGEHIGFTREPGSYDVNRIAVNYSIDDVEMVRNFQNFGFLPELIGRFKRVVPFHALGEGELEKILRGKVLSQYEHEFQLEGKKLLVDEDVIKWIIKRSLKKETGARGLEASLVSSLEDAAFEAYSKPESNNIRIFMREGVISFEIG